eukprot:9468023-Pyramimonas_sp.AAC.1
MPCTGPSSRQACSRGSLARSQPGTCSAIASQRMRSAIVARSNSERLEALSENVDGKRRHWIEEKAARPGCPDVPC